jgi:PAS domain S-box-containing protein
MTNHSDGMKHSKSNIRKDDFSTLLSDPDSSVWDLIFDSMPDMVALIDLNNTIVKANKAMLQKLKIGDQGIVGHSCYNLMHDSGCANANCPHLSMIRDHKDHSIELYEPKFGSYLNISTTPIFDSGNRLLGSLHIARDISIQKESEAKLMEYNKELRELNQNKDKFFSIVAHDLRSPFQGMLGFTDLIIDELDTLTRDEIREYLLKVRDSSYGTFALLENLLNWSRLQTGRLQYNPSEFNLNDDVVSIISLLNSNAQSKRVNLVNNINSSHLVFADEHMVHSILLNLATNAIKFTNPGGTVTFDAKIKSMCTGEHKGKCTCKQKGMEISVSDNGVGIPEEALDKIFNIGNHYTMPGTDNEHGAGLGLILVKEMAEKHGGKLTVKSEETKGSVFSFTIPLKD